MAASDEIQPLFAIMELEWLSIAPSALSSLVRKLDQGGAGSVEMKSPRAVAFLRAGLSKLLSFTNVAADEAEHRLECPSYLGLTKGCRFIRPCFIVCKKENAAAMKEDCRKRRMLQQ
ncbi:hypothetical protein OSB04_007920 [Centaurea solstitialis]|uniref:Uncharacterized protein n=1 Tax=Centaurea solstitialis TaxID=347529 RepID=A0AA38WR45_9ASTR|nr:hypothetical protein OSB04_007920 [Centaurea solstitialis]